MFFVTFRRTVLLCATVCKTVRPMLSCLSYLSCLSVTLVYCEQTVGWITVKLSVQVGLGPGHIVLDGDPAPSFGGGTAPNFRPMSVVAKRLDGLRCHLVSEVGLGPGDFVFDGTQLPSEKRAQPHPIFGLCML